jgi:hypothetical protein
VSFGFFSEFYRITLEELQIDPQLESTIRPKAQGLHSIWNAILWFAFSIWFPCWDNMSTIEDLQENNSGTLGNYSGRLQDYSRISLSTFQPREDFKTTQGSAGVPSSFGNYSGRLVLHDTCWRRAQGLQRNNTRLGSCACPTPCKVLLAIHD